tara:strand:- start:796 stop:2247 length:1452 start_codon:yes stop_codon:yes gene_type:complete
MKNNIKKLKQFYTKGIQGISTHILKQFEHDNNLKKAIYQAMPILHNIKDKSLKLKNDFIQQDVLNFYDKDTVVPYSPVSAKGPWIVDKNGSVIYDVGGYGMLGFGHCPEWALTTLAKPHVMANIMTPNNIQLEFTELLKKKIGMNRPDKKCPYSKFAFLNSGSEGMEFALRVNDINNEKNMKPPAFIVLKSGFHGRTTSASLISDSTKKTYQKHMKSYDTSDSVFPVVVNNLQHLQDMFFSLKNGGYDIKAIVMEPVMGEGNPGQMLSKNFYNMARQLTKDHDANLIIDSVQAGIRTNGYLSIVDYPRFKDEEAPDMEVFSKAINAGQYPLSVIAVNDKIANHFKTGIYGNTMTGNPKALEIGIETLKRLTPELIDNIEYQGNQITLMLNMIHKRFPFIVEGVSGQGLLNALHIHEKYPVVNGKDGLEYMCRKNGLNVIHGGKNALRFTPYFNITTQEIHLIENILVHTLEEFTNTYIRKKID